MAISGIIIHDSDDTITIDLCTLQGPSHRLKLVSSVGRLLVCALQKAIQRLVPHFPSAPYTLVCPSLAPQQPLDTDHTTTTPITHWRHFLSQPWQQQKITSQSIQSDNSNSSLYNTITTRFEAVLMAYCAALNLDKRRFGYAITKSQQRSRLYSISILPSNEINGNFASYSKYELLALFRALRHMVSLKVGKKPGTDSSSVYRMSLTLSHSTIFAWRPWQHGSSQKATAGPRAISTVCASQQCWQTSSFFY
jgi:hypothetical protein